MTSFPVAPRARRKLSEQLAEIDRELAARRKDYAKFVSAGKLRQVVADYQVECLADARASRSWLKDNRAACLAFMAAQHGADAATGEVA